MNVNIVATLAIVYAGFTALAIAAAVSIVRKAGYSGWWVATGIVPVANVVLLFAFAFADWPVLKELRRPSPSRHASQGHPGFSYPPQGHPGFAPAQPVQQAQGHPNFAAQPQSYPPAQGYPPAQSYPPTQPVRPATTAPAQYQPLYPPPPSS